MSTGVVSAEVVEARRRWIEALESGEYEQARRRLRHDDTYCCLGVACDLFGDGEWFGDAYNKVHYSLPPANVTEAVGLADEGRDRPGELTVLATANDDGLTFPEIAALLRSDEWFGPDLDRVVS